MTRALRLFLSGLFIVCINILDMWLLDGRPLKGVELLMLAFIGAWCAEQPAKGK